MSGQRVIETRLQDALRDVAVANVPASVEPPGLPPAAPRPSRKRRSVVIGAMGAAAAAVIAVAFAGASLRPDAGPHRAGSPSGTSTPTDTAAPSTAVVVGGFCDNFVPSGCSRPHYQPLWPYTSYTEAQRYRGVATDPSQAWRRSPTAVGDHYLRALGYRGIAVSGHAPDYRRGPSLADYDLADRSGKRVGSLSLGQYGLTADAPWEAIGFPTFTHPRHLFGIDLPTRTEKVGATFTVHGRQASPGALVRVRTISVDAVLSSVAVHADTSGHWTATVTAASRGVTTVAADSGGTSAQPARLILMGFGHA